MQYFKDGQVKKEALYKDGLRDSVITSFYSNGAVYYSGLYNKGVRTGEWKYFNIEGGVDTIINFK